MSNVYKQIQVGKVVLKVKFDYDAESPRKWDNLGKMVCWHRRYNLGDDHDFKTPSDFQREINERNAIILPLYLYDHSGITMNTTGFSCPWDSGQVGYIYALKEDVKREYGVKRISKKLKEMVERQLVAEVEVYDQFIQGNTFGFVLEDEDGNEIDSCWGFIGDDFVENGMKDYLPKEFHEAIAKL